MIKLSLTIPKIDPKWWDRSKRELNQAVEEYNRSTWPKQKDPVTLKPWAPRKPPTGSWPILRRTGEMQDSAKFKTGKQPLSFYAKVVNYGPYLQYGTKNMPARRWLGIGPQLMDPMAKIIGKNIFLKRKQTFRIP